MDTRTRIDVAFIRTFPVFFMFRVDGTFKNNFSLGCALAANLVGNDVEILRKQNFAFELLHFSPCT
jgi:hypothetical protein